MNEDEDPYMSLLNKTVLDEKYLREQHAANRRFFDNTVVMGMGDRLDYNAFDTYKPNASPAGKTVCVTNCVAVFDHISVDDIVIMRCKNCGQVSQQEWTGEFGPARLLELCALLSETLDGDSTGDSADLQELINLAKRLREDRELIDDALNIYAISGAKLKAALDS